jgi:hypothetical protein
LVKAWVREFAGWLDGPLAMDVMRAVHTKARGYASGAGRFQHEIDTEETACCSPRRA